MNQDLEFIRQTIFKYLDPTEVQAFIFGSRATDKAQKFSDYDIGLISEISIDPEKFYSIVDDLDNSDLPYRIDLVNFKYVSEDFKQVALKQIIKLN